MISTQSQSSRCIAWTEPTAGNLDMSFSMCMDGLIIYMCYIIMLRRIVTVTPRTPQPHTTVNATLHDPLHTSVRGL